MPTVPEYLTQPIRLTITPHPCPQPSAAGGPVSACAGHHPLMTADGANGSTDGGGQPATLNSSPAHRLALPLLPASAEAADGRRPTQMSTPDSAIVARALRVLLRRPTGGSYCPRPANAAEAVDSDVGARLRRCSSRPASTAESADGGRPILVSATTSTAAACVPLRSWGPPA